MKHKAGMTERFRPREYKPIQVVDLDGCFCEACGEGFWSARSERKISATLSIRMAEQDSRRVVAAEVISVQDAAKILGVTEQGAHKMMKEGRLRYVIVAGRRYPIRKFLARERKHAIA
jgi:excisionase family DNA binding protein